MELVPSAITDISDLLDLVNLHSNLIAKSIPDNPRFKLGLKIYALIISIRPCYNSIIIKWAPCLALEGTDSNIVASPYSSFWNSEFATDILQQVEKQSRYRRGKFITAIQICIK